MRVSGVGLRQISGFCALVLVLFVAACGKGGGGGGTTAYTVGGTITGLSGTVVLQNSGGNNLTISANGAFTFSNSVASGSHYAVTVFTQPTNLSQTCSVSNGSGTVGSANVTNVAIMCVTNNFTIGGTVSGLSGTGLVLRNNGGNNLAVSASGTFTFSTPIASGSPYAVTVFTSPTGPSQTGTITNGSGMVGSANVTSVTVTCVAVAPPSQINDTGITASQCYQAGGDVVG